MQFFLSVRTDAGPVSAVWHQLFCPNPDSARKCNDTQKAPDSAALAVINGLILKQRHLSVLYPSACGKANGTLSPNPDNLTSEAAIITSAAAGTADRVIAYFDKDVDASQFMKDGKPDKTKFDCEIKTGLDSSFSNTTGDTRSVIAILPVANEPKALEILVNEPLRDNANASIKFKDKRTSSNIDTTNTVNFRLADAREPSVLSVESTGTKTIDITFSEAVLPKAYAGNYGANYSAQNIDNYLIDGRPLSDWGIVDGDNRDSEGTDSASSDISRTQKEFPSDEGFSQRDGKVTLHSYTVKDKVGTDNRHKVTITVGSGFVLPAGNHMLTIKNVGDWAAQTDGARNSVSTQVLPFTVTENAEKPEFTVNVQSPEQYELNFNTDFKLADSGDQFASRDTSVDGDASVLVLQERVNGTWTTISNGTAASSTKGQNPVTISRVGGDGKKYLVEVKRDWSEVYDFEHTRTDYYNKELRLHVDAGKLVNVSNNLRNDEINIELNANDAKVTNGNIMKEADLTSPTVVGITQAVAKNGSALDSWNVEFSEPVKISGEANIEGLTPSQKQKDGVNKGNADLVQNQGVPVAFARFVNVDNPSMIVEGIVEENFFIDAEDKIINVAPEKKLSAGSWRLVVGSVSDDYGSTLATDGQVIEVTTESVATNFKVVWAAVATDRNYDNAYMGNTPDKSNRGSYVFVKFNKPVDLATALDENNYALNNQPLPHGANIYANIQNYDDQDSVVDSVTIALPTNSNLLYQNYTVDTLSTQLSINGVVAAGTGEALSGSGMNQLPYNIGRSDNEDSDINDVNIKTTYVNDEHDAVWGNAAKEKSTHADFKTDEDYYRALKSALDDDKYRAVEIDSNAFANLTGTKKEAAQKVFGKNLVLEISRPVDIDLGGNTFPGNVVVSTTDAAGTMTIKNGTINGVENEIRSSNASLKVNAGVIKHFVLDNVTVNKGVNDYPVVLDNVYTESFETKGRTAIKGTKDDANADGAIYVTDADGFGFTNDVTWAGNLVINTNGVINLKGSLQGAKIFVQQAATLNLGTVNEDGSVKETLLIDEAQIFVDGPEAKVMLTEAAKLAVQNDPSKLPSIVVGAKDVKVYLAENANQTFGTAQCIKVDKGNVIAIDKNGKTTTNTNLETDAINKKDNTTGIQKAFESLKMVSGSTEANVTITYDEFKAVSGSAFDVQGIGEGKITKKTFTESIAEKVADLVATSDYGEIVKADGTPITASDLTVTCSVPSGSKVFSSTTSEITLKDKPVGNFSETITVSLNYNGKTYTRTIKVTQ